MDALATYFQIKVAEEDQHKATFMLNAGRYYFCKTFMGINLSSYTWRKASTEVIGCLPVTKNK